MNLHVEDAGDADAVRAGRAALASPPPPPFPLLVVWPVFGLRRIFGGSEHPGLLAVRIAVRG